MPNDGSMLKYGDYALEWIMSRGTSSQSSQSTIKRLQIGCAENTGILYSHDIF